MCRVLEVSRGGFYRWLTRPESTRARSNRELTAKVKDIHQDSRETYGSPRIHAELRRQGEACGKNRVARVMREAGLRGKCRKRFKPQTTDSKHDFPIAPNLVNREFTAEAPNQLWLSDITYIPTLEGWLYLASIIDVFSRRIIGWAMDDNMRKELALSALEMAVTSRRPDSGLIHHSDRGSQYASKDYRKALKSQDIDCSMSGKGNCYDNAMKESFFHTLKVECVHGEVFETRKQAKSVIFEYIEAFYNRSRIHSGLGYSTPLEVETAVA